MIVLPRLKQPPILSPGCSRPRPISPSQRDRRQRNGSSHQRQRSSIARYQIFSASIADTEYLIGYEGSAFARTGDVVQDLLGITAVHPMREEAVNEFLARAGADGSVVSALVAQGELVMAEYGGRKYLLRQLPSSRSIAPS